MLVVIDASTIVGAALKRESVPRRALLLACNRHTILLSDPIFAEIGCVLARTKFAPVITPEVRADILGLLTAAATWRTPTTTVADCRNPKDNIYLELAVSADADIIVSSDDD